MQLLLENHLWKTGNESYNHSTIRLTMTSSQTRSQTSSQTSSQTRSHYAWILATIVTLGIALSVGLVQWTEYQHFVDLERQGNERLELYASTVQSAKQRFDYLPYIVSQDQQARDLLKGKDDSQRVNIRLQSWQMESSAAALYLMDQKGKVLASSNWQDEKSFVGNNYHFRPYFQDAIRGGEGQFFAVGVSTGRPGLFLSRPVLDEDEIIGVAVVKIDMAQLETDWALGGELVLIVDPDGIVFLSSNAKWKYKSLEPVDNQTLKRLNDAQKYSDRSITPLNILQKKQSPQGHTIIELVGPTTHARDRQTYLMHHRPLSKLNWTLYYLTDLKGLVSKKRSALVIAGLITLLLALIGFIIVNRIQSRKLLEVRVAERTKALNQTNQQLIEEIDNRIETEEQLRQTHEELVQAEKLAALGQMSAGIVHEISQPLSAMNTFAASTRLLLDRGEKQKAMESLDDISSMVRRVTSIVSHLKNFASKSRGQTAPIEVHKVIDNALLLLRSRLDKSELKLTVDNSEPKCYVIADEIKLEQILINLIRNALDAMQQPPTQDTHQLKIWIEANANTTSIFISDTGTGINADDLPKVFDPFFTTKAPTEGLGLGLSVSYGIAKEFGGNLEVVDGINQGTRFKLSLDTAKTPDTSDDR